MSTRTPLRPLALAALAAASLVIAPAGLDAQFAAPREIDSVETSVPPVHIHAADIDADGDADLVVSWGGQRGVVRHRNVGGGSFTGALEMPMIETRAFETRTVDTDQDGDLDIISLAEFPLTFFTYDAIVEYTNIGNFQFEEQTTLVGGTFSTGGPLNALAVDDLQGDGLDDVIVATWVPGEILVQFGAPGGLLDETQIATSAAARDLITADLDGDGDTDVLLRSSIPELLAWRENLDGMGTLGPPQALDAPAQNIVSTVVGDLDGDGDLDVLRTESAAVTDDTVLWYENLGAGTFAAAAALTTDGLEAKVIALADLDLDGDLDLVRGETTGVSWFPNDGQGGLGPRRIISDSVGDCSALEIADVDGDGLPDLVLGVRPAPFPELLHEIVWIGNKGRLPWQSLGQGLAGTQGVPTLWGEGTLVAGSAGSLNLADAAPLAVSLFAASFSTAPAAFECGVLVPGAPFITLRAFVTDNQGRIELPWASWPAGFSGLSLYLQALVGDPMAPCAVAHSNALQADIP